MTRPLTKVKRPTHPWKSKTFPGGLGAAPTVDVRSTWSDDQKGGILPPPLGPVSLARREHYPIYYKDGEASTSRRARPRHKERSRTAPPKFVFGKTELGPIAARCNVGPSDITGRISAALEKLFRSKSQQSRRVMERIQLSLIGHIYSCDSYFRTTARYLRYCGEYKMVYERPSFKAVRLILMDIKNCNKTSWKIREVIGVLPLCTL
jgi:hypothetical protein